MIPKILLIDDDELVIKSLKNMLTRKGYEVKCAKSAIEAISLVAVQNFDLVISDIRMPGENGIIAVEKIKKIYEEKRIPCGFMFISGYAEEDTPAHAIRLGVNKFLFKPFDNEVLIKSIEEELKLLREERELKQAPKAAPTIILRKKSLKEKITTKRAVITGIGVIAPSGPGKEAYWKSLREGKNFVDTITHFDCSAYPSKGAAEIRSFNPADFLPDPHEAKRMGRSSHLAVAASRLAFEDAKLDPAKNSAVGVIIGSATSGHEYIEPDIRAMERGGIRRARPFLGIAGFAGAISSEVSRAVGAKGPSFTLSTGCTAGTDAMGYALEQIRYGKANVLVTGGADACVTPGILAAFCQMGATSIRQDVKTASRPFNKDRDGFVIAEGSWMFILEELEHALKRGAKIYGELLGYGSTCDAWQMAKPHPSGEGTAQAVRLALTDAGIEPQQVDVFEAYGNATRINDSYETGVVKKVFGKHAYELVMPSTKSMFGHPIGASGGQQLAAALLALNEGFIHSTINYEIPDPECDLDYVPNKGREGKFKVAVCNSLAFGAKNSAMVVTQYQNKR